VTKLRTLALSTLAIILACACQKESEKPPSDMKESIVRLRADILICQQRERILPEDTARARREKDSLFALYHISEKEYDDAISGYKSDLDRWKEFHLMVINRLEDLQHQQSPQKDTTKKALEK